MAVSGEVSLLLSLPGLLQETKPSLGAACDPHQAEARSKANNGKAAPGAEPGQTEVPS